MIRAVELFNYNDNQSKLSTYIIIHIRNQIKKFYSQKQGTLIRRPRNGLKDIYIYNSGKEMSENRIKNVLNIMSLEKRFIPVKQEEIFSNDESPYETLIKYENMKILNDLIKSFNPVKQKIITLRFFENQTLSEIAIEVGLTKERIRQIEQSILADFKCALGEPKIIAKGKNNKVIVDKELLTKAIEKIESTQTFTARSIMYEAVAKEYNASKSSEVFEINGTITSLRIKEFNIPFKTPVGKRGRKFGTSCVLGSCHLF